jgi:hypothetical protein
MKKMSKAQRARRERIATLAMAAIISKTPSTRSPDNGHPEDLHFRAARGARSYADALIKELDKK